MRDHGGDLAPHGPLPVVPMRTVARYKSRNSDWRYTLTRCGLLLMCVLERPGHLPDLLWSRPVPSRAPMCE